MLTPFQGEEKEFNLTLDYAAATKSNIYANQVIVPLSEVDTHRNPEDPTASALLSYVVTAAIAREG